MTTKRDIITKSIYQLSSTYQEQEVRVKKAVEAIPNIRLQYARRERNWLQQYVADRVGTTSVNVSRWEKGITCPSPRFRHKLCELFEMGLEELGLLPETCSANNISPTKYLLLNEDKVSKLAMKPVYETSMPNYLRPTLVMMAGLPDTGKTTIAFALASELGWQVIDKDVYRETPLKQGVDESDSSKLAMKPVYETSMPFTAEEIEWILEQAGHHPSFIQCVCHYLFEEKSSQNLQGIDWDSVKTRAYEKLLPLFIEIWECLTKQQQEQLKFEVLKQDRLNELSKSSLFCQFVRENYLQQPLRRLFNINSRDVEEVLDNINYLDYLGKSELRNLNIVSLHFEKDSMVTSSVRGRIVCEILHKAFECLRGPGVRNDSAAEWRLYNILYYRYFRYHLSNEQISARLGIRSMRQYYRYRQRAISALSHTLLEMEVASYDQNIGFGNK